MINIKRVLIVDKESSIDGGKYFELVLRIQGNGQMLLTGQHAILHGFTQEKIEINKNEVKIGTLILSIDDIEEI